MKPIHTAFKGVAIDFAVFWGIRIPAFVTRITASVSASRKAQDTALYGVSIVAVSLLASGVLA